MTFKKFTQFGRRNSSFISITSSHSFGFGGDFLQISDLADYNYVELFFDNSDDGIKIAFKFVRNQGDSAFKLIENKGTNSRSIVARSFFTTFLKDVNIDEFKNKYVPEMVNDDEFGKLFVIKLIKK
ncbi:hypothetical protein C4569_02115 [Candidatus Parcubacteria bacterium]|nr:MAG: hypothetical protein C4569_02115 [Candidatus Parcubacteria bacterium]